MAVTNVRLTHNFGGMTPRERNKFLYVNVLNGLREEALALNAAAVDLSKPRVRSLMYGAQLDSDELRLKLQNSLQLRFDGGFGATLTGDPLEAIYGKTRLPAPDNRARYPLTFNKGVPSEPRLAPWIDNFVALYPSVVAAEYPDVPGFVDSTLPEWDSFLHQLMQSWAEQIIPINFDMEWLYESKRRAQLMAKRCAQSLKKGHVNEAIHIVFEYVLFVFFTYPAIFYDYTQGTPEAMLSTHYGFKRSKPLSVEDRKLLNNVLADLLIATKSHGYLARHYELCADAYPIEARVKLANFFVQNQRFSDASIILGDLRRIDPNSLHLAPIQAQMDRLMRVQSIMQDTGVDLGNLNDLSGVEFERMVQVAFRQLGFRVDDTPVTGDFGADVVLHTASGAVVVVQCKRYQAKLNLKAVQEVLGAMNHYAADFGLVITNSGYLKSAKTLAESSDVELWGADELAKLFAGDLSFSVLRDL